jgi:hypothetical protein
VTETVAVLATMAVSAAVGLVALWLADWDHRNTW